MALEGEQSVGSLAAIRNLSIKLPDGTAILAAASTSLGAGKVIALLGPSGAGKTTILRAIFSPQELRDAGYSVSWDERVIASEPAFVPQRGALLDHLDVGENIALAQAGSNTVAQPKPWLEAVDLSVGLDRSVATLSGGQAQRLAVARVLAAGRRLIVMDEPSVGLDPVGVRMLARLLVKQAREHQAAIVVITHDLAFAGGAADEILFLDPVHHSLVRLDWEGPAEFDENSIRLQRLAKLEEDVEHLLLQERPASIGGANARVSRNDPLAPLRIAGTALSQAFHPHLLTESAVVFRRTLRESLVRPAFFYTTVGALLGFTVPYVIANISKDLRPAAVFELIKGTYILSLSPPLSAIIFAATSGSAVNAWLGGLRLHGQVTALEGLGVPPARYLWSPAWLALVTAYVVTVLLFTLSMIMGGWVLYSTANVPNAFSLLTADFLDPPPSRYPYVVRGLWSVIAYTIAAASIVVAKGSEPKSRSDDVTAAMTSSVMRVTLFVVVMELLTVMLVRAWES